MAVARLHKASVLDPSVLWGNKERPTTRTSSIRKMWRDLESERRSGENERQQVSLVLTGNLESPSSSSLEGEGMSMDANEIENKCPPNHNQIGLQNGQEDVHSSCLQRSHLGVPEKDRVRKIFHEWGSKSFGGESHKPYSSRMNNSSRARLLGENECKRVRTVREWIESSTQQGDTSRTGLEESSTEIGSRIERVRDGSVDCGVGSRRSYRRLYGRQALLDLLTKFERERERELDGLLESRFVSNFSHRHRIQALLRGRFLLNQRFAQDEKQTSVAASELGLLRRTHAVSDIRKGFLSKLNNQDQAPEGARSDTLSDNDIKYDHIEQAEEIFQEIPDEIGEEFETTNLSSNWELHNPQEFASSVGEREQQPLTVEFTETRSQDQDDSVERNQDLYHIESSQGPLPEVDEVMIDHYQTNAEELEVHDVEEWQESVTEDDDGEWHRLNENEDGWYQETAGSDFQESHEEWYENVLEDATGSWFGGNSYQEAAPVGRNDAFYASDDDNGSRFELRELTSRRRVSNLLQSDFGTRLEQLMQSYLDRQDQAFDSETENEWMPDREQQDPEQQNVDENTRTQVPDDTHQHLGTEREMIKGLRIDMDTLQQRMNDMHRMLEACMDMQVHLQRSVQQEVYSAFNRLSNSRDAREDGMQSYESESSPGKEVCFLCCDDSFDSLPHRCAHMHICSKCGEKVNWSKLKESVRHP